MKNISMNQSLDVWSELWQAYFGKNKYGGNTAEIYGHVLMSHSPILNSQDPNGRPPRPEVNRAAGLRAARSLYALLEKFKEDTGCKIMVNEEEFGEWVKDLELTHRCHVQVIPGTDDDD